LAFTIVVALTRESHGSGKDCRLVISDMPFTKKRKFTRVPFDTEIKVISGEKVIIALGIRDISLGGAFIITDESLTENTACKVTLSLIGPASLLRIEIEAEILRSEAQGIAVEFTSIDLDGLVHLKHFIEVHALDPDTIEREFRGNLLQL
jgi:hypothetical protein